MNTEDLTFVFDRTAQDVQNLTSKGVYNASDLNRVESDCRILNELLTAFGYPSDIVTKENWSDYDFPYAIEMERIRKNISAIRDNFFVMSSTPDTPASLDYLNYLTANDIEKILYDLYQVYQIVMSMTPRLNNFYLGGI